MVETVIRKAGTWREKVKVLCIYRYYYRERNATIEAPDAVMVEVEFPDQIPYAFMSEMFKRRQMNYELVSYLPEHGKKTW